MLNLALRILLRNGWLTASLCFGLLTAVAVTTSIPLYTRGALQRVLIRDLVDYRDREDIYPGGFTISRRFSSARYSAEVFKELPKYEEHVRRSFEVDLSLPIEISTSRLDIKSLYILDADREFDFDLVRSTNLIALSDLPSHISIVAGDLPSEIARDDVFEVLVTEEAMFENDYLLGKTYEIFDVRLNRVCSVLIAGVFQVDPSSKGYWYANLADLDNAVFMDPKLFRSILSTQSVWLADARWYFGLDLSQLHTSEIGSLKRNMEKQMSSLDDLGASVSTPLIGIIDDYLEKQANIILLLLFIIVPVLVILVYFLIMLAGIIMESEANDIALLKSRGASSGRVITLYLIVFSIPTILALVAGPFAGVGIARLIGTSSGFLRFGNTEGFSTSLSFGVWLYGLAAVTLCFSTVLAPIIKSSKTTIVIHKTRQARIGRSWLWKGLIPAIALALIALYGLYSFGIRQQILTATSAKGGDLPLDPIYLVAASLFIFGVGMLVLRLLPLVVLSIFAIVRRITSASLYAAITRIGRSFTRERYAFLFLLLTVASGIFFASTARSTNLATSHKFLYANGTDVRLLFATSGSSERFLDFLKERRRLIEAYPALDEVQSSGVRYSRSVYDYERIAGVESATIASRIPEAVLVTPSGRRLNVSILAIDPVSFGKTSWYRNDLNPYNLRSYLETLIKYPDHIFLSTGSFEGYQSSTKPFSVQVPGYNPFEVYMVDTFDFWPTINPVEIKATGQGYILCNLRYLEAMIPLGELEVWIRRTKSVDDIDFYRSLLENGLAFRELINAGEEVRKEINQPQYAGINGILSLSYLVTVVVCLLGFLVSWIVSLHERRLQFGVYRSLGMSSASVVQSLAFEQIVVSGSAVIAGSGIGAVVSRLFLPIIGLTSSASEQIPPIQIGAYRSDYYAIVAIVGALLLFAFGFIALFISKMKVSEALKLGEE